MKTIKTLICALTVILALVFCAPSARAVTPGIGMTTNFTVLNVSLIVITNGPLKVATNSAGQTYTSTAGKATINNAFLLNVFAAWDDQPAWPAGSKLVIGWDEQWDGDVLVVDGNGTNVLYDASAGVDNYFIAHPVQNQQSEGATAGKDVEGNPGSLNYKAYSEGYFELYDDEVYLPFTDISGSGSSAINFTQNWNASGAGTTWNLTADLTVENSAGLGEYFLNMDYVTVGGTLDTSGSGKGFNDTFGP